MDETRPKKKVTFTDIPKSTRQQIYDAIARHEAENVKSFLILLKKDIAKIAHIKIVKTLILDINTYAKQNEGYDREFVREILKYIISIYSREIFLDADMNFILMMLTQNKYANIVQTLRDDVVAALKQTASKAESIQVTTNASPGGADSTTTHSIGIEPNEDNTKNKNSHNHAKLNDNNDNTPLSLELLLGQYFSWLEDLPTHLQNQIQNSYVYKAIAESIQASLRVFEFPDLTFKFFSGSNKNNDDSICDSRVTVHAPTQENIDMDLIYEAPVPLYVDHYKFIGHIGNEASLFNF